MQRQKVRFGSIADMGSDDASVCKVPIPDIPSNAFSCVLGSNARATYNVPGINIDAALLSRSGAPNYRTSTLLLRVPKIAPFQAHTNPERGPHEIQAAT